MKAPVDLVAIARELGFARAAVIPIEAPRRHALYESWLAGGHAGEMHYLATPEHRAQRADLRTLLATARSLIVVALAYDREDPVPGDRLLRGKIARYARGEDYHLVMRDKLVLLADRLARELGVAIASRPCVDSAPVLEREWAERAGVGFIAKNTMLIAPGLGSYVVLGELLVDQTFASLRDAARPAEPGLHPHLHRELEITAPPEPPKPRCGSCRSCLDACPTQAFTDAYLLDARRCISYLTIEHHGWIPRELRPLIGTWVFGCDVCQEVCPFNSGKVTESTEPRLRPRSLEHALPDLIALARLGTNQMRQRIRRTALRRVPREVLLRNVAVALGNTRDPAAIPALVELLAHPAPLVRGHAAWALGQLDDDAARAAIADALAREPDPVVRDELAGLTSGRGTAGSPPTPRSP